MSTPGTVSVIGAGSWGTALAQQLARRQHQVRLWGRNREHLAEINRIRCNQRYLPNITLSDNVTAFDLADPSLSQTLKDSQLILLVVPSSAFRETIIKIKPYCSDNTLLAWACKGLEQDSAKRLHQILLEEWPGIQRYGVISGPTFALELAKGYPTAITVAANSDQASGDIADFLHGDRLRCYTSTDIVGVELGGAIKNALAIATGIADGLNFGANTRSALITRGLSEMVKLGAALGGQANTFYGLAGLGDLILTCTDDQSRNRQLGLALGRGHSLTDALEAIDQVVEGVNTARELHQLMQTHNIDMPICDSVYRVLYEGLAPTDAVYSLLERELKAE
ncbi:MAG: NAD(P)-dependent glycerol-3-phosphate dehydrogenase [Gammaproteobacteria bacterium]|nr:NAD(P)-dependent glycerol-3-phosphate dehydrogenase [Gammaproteobacteria bacterium]